MEDLELKIYMFNYKNRRIFSLEENFLNIYFFAWILEEKQEKFEKLFKEDELFLKFSKIEKNFLEITENIENCISSQKDFLKILQKIWKKDFINFEKYDLWLKNNLLLPLKNMKNILENHKNFTEKLLEENKNNNSEQILVLNKRLELQRETLAKHILLLDEKISIFEK